MTTRAVTLAVVWLSICTTRASTQGETVEGLWVGPFAARPIVAFLTIDHINNDGAKRIALLPGRAIYQGGHARWQNARQSDERRGDVAGIQRGASKRARTEISRVNASSTIMVNHNIKPFSAISSFVGSSPLFLFL
jgi:hypothetical protein